MGFAPILVSLAAPAPPAAIGFYRVLIAGALLSLALPALGAARPRGREWVLGLLAGACFAGDLAFWHVSIFESGVARATLLVNSAPIYVGLYARLAEGRRLGPHFAAGAAVAIAGVALLVGAFDDARGLQRGDAFGLLAGVCYAGYQVLAKQVRDRLPTVTAVWLTCLGAAPVLLAVGLASGERFAGYPWTSWLAVFGLAVGVQLLGILLVVWALRRLQATFVSVGFLLQPVAAAALAWALLAQTLTATQVLGGILVLVGVAVVARDPSSRS
ncbi:MAG: DMT family transporter [Proteobacteria bacterium]|nr:DMT family transporter [Pseudomonadota bacterium]